MVFWSFGEIQKTKIVDPRWPYLGDRGVISSFYDAVIFLHNHSIVSLLQYRCSENTLYLEIYWDIPSFILIVLTINIKAKNHQTSGFS